MCTDGVRCTTPLENRNMGGGTKKCMRLVVVGLLGLAQAPGVTQAVRAPPAGRVGEDSPTAGRRTTCVDICFFSKQPPPHHHPPPVHGFYVVWTTGRENEKCAHDRERERERGGERTRARGQREQMLLSCQQPSLSLSLSLSRDTPTRTCTRCVVVPPISVPDSVSLQTGS